MQIAPEQLSIAFIDDFETLVNGYYDETPAHEGMPPFDFDWFQYMKLQEMDKLLILTCRGCDGKLMGAVMYFVTDHMHHRGYKVALGDMLVTALEHRHKGVATKLLIAAEAELKQLGVNRMSHAYREVYKTTPLYERHGFFLDERMYSKDIS